MQTLSVRDRVTAAIIGTLGSLLVLVLGRTLRVEWLGQEHDTLLEKAGKKKIYVFWHEHLLTLTYTHRRRGICVLVSRHRDGEFIAKVLHRLGFSTARGSSSRGGSEGALEMCRSYRKGWDLGVTPDGPRGPRRRAQPGAVRLAQLTGASLLPMAVAAEKRIVLNSWDRFQIPLPFSRVVIAYDEPVEVARSASASEIDALRERLEESLTRVSATAQAAATVSARASFAVQMYGALTTILFAVCSPVALVGLARDRRKWLNRLGRVNVPSRVPRPGKRRLWIHAASVGEVRATAKLVKHICEDSDSEVVFSTTTPAGQAVARSCLDGPRAFFFLPLDVPFAVTRAVGTIDADSLVLVETELWPALIAEAKRKGMKVAVVNGKVSDKAGQRYASFSYLFRHLFGLLDVVVAQSERNARKFEQLGTPRERISVAGNIKQDAQEISGARLGMRETLGWPPSDVVFIAGSTRPGEERPVCEGFREARSSFEGLRLVLAPRHLKRVDEVLRTVDSLGLTRSRWSRVRGAACDAEQGRAVHSEARPGAAGAGEPGQGVGAAPPAPPDVLILDTIGDLAAAYHESDVAFVGGTLSGHGGHNILEPASAGLAILAGPSRENIEEESGVLSERGALLRVENAMQISDILVDLARSGEERRTRGGKALEFYRSRPVASLIAFGELRKAGII